MKSRTRQTVACVAAFRRTFDEEHLTDGVYKLSFCGLATVFMLTCIRQQRITKLLDCFTLQPLFYEALPFRCLLPESSTVPGADTADEFDRTLDPVESSVRAKALSFLRCLHILAC